MIRGRRVIGWGLLAVWLAAGAASADADPVPPTLKPPPTEVLTLAAHGVGVQIYACQPAKDDPKQFAWTLLAPEAELSDQHGDFVAKHYAGPTWEAIDGSKVIGDVVARDAGPDASAIPWLLLRAQSAAGPGRFGDITFIQRLHTVGGKAPATGCAAASTGQELRVNYAADYDFYVAAKASAAKSDYSTPLGIWKTVDDKTGAARALVRIYEEDGKLFGRLERSFTAGAENRVCAVCSDERKNRPIIGLVIIRNLQREGDEWSGGDILDPESGSVYQCKLHLEDGGARLIVRGYLGFSLLGRSQTWQRQS